MRELSKRSTIVLTGATGSLGSELFVRLVRGFPEATIVVLMRARDDTEAHGRLKSVQNFVALSDAEMSNVRVVRADLAKLRLGIAELEYAELALKSTTVFHVAANVDFDASYPISREANVDATNEILTFCRRAGGARLVYVSTAFVAGDRRGLLHESELNVGQRFWNAYEQTKCEAEELVRAAAATVPVTMFRPSQIIGDSRDGRIGKLFGYYEFAKLSIAGRLRVLAADPDARADLIPVDYVCDAMLYLARLPQSIGETYHLAAGLNKSLTIRAITDLGQNLMRSRFGVSVPPTHIVRAEFLGQFVAGDEEKRYRNSSLFILMKSYAPYLAYERNFDVQRTHTLLESAGIHVPDIATVLNIATERLVAGAKNMLHLAAAAL